jgi:hypothetical protein
MYFQLQASTLPIGETEFGLLLTPNLVQIAETPEKYQERQKKRTEDGLNQAPHPNNKYNCLLSQVLYSDMLPTPTTRDWKGAQANEYKEMRGEETEYKMQSLPGLAMKGILPTPSAFDWNTAQKVDKYEERKQMQAVKGVNLHYPLKQMAMDINPNGTTSQLSPQFVLEMMGFPTDWTLLPFLSGETNQSKQEETQ